MQQLSIVVIISVLAWTFLRSVRPLGPPLIESKNKPQLRMALTGFFERMGKCMAKAVSGEKEDGTNVISAKNIAALRNDVAKAESKLISYLKDRNVSRLPERQTPEPELDDKEHKAEQKSSNPRSAVGAIEVMQPIKADRAGNIKVTIKQFALDLGLHQGCHVQDGVGDKMKEGVVQLVHDDYVQIQFEKGDKKYHAESAIEKLTIVAQEKKRKVDAPADHRAEPIEWNVVDDADVHTSLTSLLHMAMCHIQREVTPDSSKVRFHIEANGMELTTEKAAEPHSLVFIPFAKSYEFVPSDSPLLKKRKVAGKSKADLENHIFLKIMVKGTTASDIVKANPPDEPETMLPFWRLLMNASFHVTGGPSTLRWTTCKYEIPMRALHVDKTKGSYSNASKTSTIQLMMPCLVNYDKLEAGVPLRIPQVEPPDC